MSDTLASMSPYDWLLKLAVLQASNDPREAPWYGPWNIVLKDMFQDFCPKKREFITATYPQSPLVKDIETVVSDSEEESSDEEMPEAGVYPLPLIKYLLTRINSILQVKDSRRSAAHIPESSKSHRDFRSGPPRLSPSLKKPRQRRSVHIPDFVQLLYKINVNEDGTIDDPLLYRTGILLMVEIRKASAFCQKFEILSVLDQTDEQAQHAFASFPRVNVFGLIIAVGDCWTYREYHREHLRPSPTMSEGLNPIYVDSSDTGSYASSRGPSKACNDVKWAFNRGGFARLQDQRSYAALDAVQDRLRHLASTMFVS